MRRLLHGTNCAISCAIKPDKDEEEEGKGEENAGDGKGGEDVNVVSEKHADAGGDDEDEGLGGQRHWKRQHWWDDDAADNDEDESWVGLRDRKRQRGWGSNSDESGGKERVAAVKAVN